MYILVRDDIPLGFAMVAVAHASLAGYLRFQNEPEVREWLSDDVQVARAAMIAMDLSAWFVILPLALASLATGIFQALGTPWGLVRHYWVLFKLALTVIATAVLLTKLGPIGELARAAMLSTFTLDGLSDLRNSMVVHATGGLFVLLIVAALAVFKPAGRTRIGAEQDRRADVPVWVKVSAWAMVALLVAIALNDGRRQAWPSSSWWRSCRSS